MRKKFKLPEDVEKVLNRCPICGSKLEFSALYQYEKVYGIKADGTLTSQPKLKRDVGSMECGFISCTNDDCDFHTDCDLDTEDHKHIHVFQDGSVYKYVDDREDKT